MAFKSEDPAINKISVLFADGQCTFEDFLDMMSVFSDRAPKCVKCENAFRIFDFDGDDMLGRLSIWSYFNFN